MQGADDVINEQELMQSIDNFLSENKEAMLADLKTLIGQPSVRGEAASAPLRHRRERRAEKRWPLPAAWALRRKTARATSAGPTCPAKQKANCHHHPSGCGARGQRMDFDPFEMIVEDGCVIGRGTLDDKGPAVLTLYIAKFFQRARRAASLHPAPAVRVRMKRPAWRT